MSITASLATGTVPTLGQSLVIDIANSGLVYDLAFVQVDPRAGSGLWNVTPDPVVPWFVLLLAPTSTVTIGYTPIVGSGQKINILTYTGALVVGAPLSFEAHGPAWPASQSAIVPAAPSNPWTHPDNFPDPTTGTPTVIPGGIPPVGGGTFGRWVLAPGSRGGQAWSQQLRSGHFDQVQ